MVRANNTIEHADQESGQSQEEFSISVVLPVFEEADAVKQLIPSIVETLANHVDSFEIIAVDDGSQDDTPTVLWDLKQSYPEHLRVARHLYNKGNGAALRTGSGIARGEIIVYMDSDGQHSPEDILKLISQIPPYDLVVGVRTKTYKGSWYRNVANKFYNRFASWLSGTEVKDLTSGFRALRRSAGRHFIHMYPAGFSTPTTITLSFLKAGYNVSYVPIEVKRRASGRSKIRLWHDGFRFVVIILRMVTLYDPLKVFLPVGFGLTFLGALAWIAGLIQANRLVLPNSALPNSAIFLFISALLTWLLGLVSSQIASSRVHYHGDETILIDEPPQ
jgi:glycosyltransferase involved in cell wall biosynthesis